jgi:hypothetical protein
VELQATLFGPVLSIFFSMITSLPVINWQVWTALAPAHCMCGQGRGKTQETKTFPTRPSRKDALMVSSVPYAIVSPSDRDDKIVKAVDETWGFVPNKYKKCLKQRLIPILRQNKHRSKLHKHEDFCLFSMCKLYYIMSYVCVKTNKKCF